MSIDQQPTDVCFCPGGWSPACCCYLLPLLSELREERDRLNQAIKVIENLVHGGNRLSPAGRQRISEAAKRRWREAREAKRNHLGQIT